MDDTLKTIDIYFPSDIAPFYREIVKRHGDKYKVIDDYGIIGVTIVPDARKWPDAFSSLVARAINEIEVPLRGNFLKDRIKHRIYRLPFGDELFISSVTESQFDTDGFISMQYSVKQVGKSVYVCVSCPKSRGHEVMERISRFLKNRSSVYLSSSMYERGGSKLFSARVGFSMLVSNEDGDGNVKIIKLYAGLRSAIPENSGLIIYYSGENDDYFDEMEMKIGVK